MSENNYIDEHSERYKKAMKEMAKIKEARGQITLGTLCQKNFEESLKNKN